MQLPGEAFQAEGKGPNTGTWLVCSGSSKKTRAVGAEEAGRWLETSSETVIGTFIFLECEQESLLGLEQRNDEI